MIATPATALLALALSLLATGCAERTPSPPSAPSSNATVTPAPATTDRWLGQWNGPEGTFLKLSGANGSYEITIQNLDGPRTFPARAVGDHMEFERNGVAETVRASNGAATGMKWLGEKTDCLTVRVGEGYCRD